MYPPNCVHPKCLVNIFEIKKTCQQNNERLLECKINNLIESKINSLWDSNIISQQSNISNHVLDVNKLLESKIISEVDFKIMSSESKVVEHINETFKSKINLLISKLGENAANPKNFVFLKVYLKTTSIILNNDAGPNNYFIKNSKLYNYDINGQNPQLTTGNFLIAKSDNPDYVNKVYKVSEGNLQQIQTYFDGTNLKLIIDGIEEKKDGTLILTDDYKIFVRIGNSWFGK